MRKGARRFRKFESKSLHGLSGRLVYDLQCDAIISKWKVHMKYNDTDAKLHSKSVDDYAHRTETRKQNQELTNFEKCTHLYSKKGSQTTEWKLVVYHAINSENKQLSDIARSIRKRCGTSGWDGKSTCKEFQKLRQVVRRALTVMKSNKFDAEKLASMSRSEAGKILKRKKTKM